MLQTPAILDTRESDTRLAGSHGHAEQVGGEGVEDMELINMFQLPF